MNSTLRRLFLASALLSTTLAFAGDAAVAPGKPAPAIDVTTWLKGSPVTGFDAHKTYVVEFWATWCGPCIQSIPHLTELAHQYKDKVTFVGVSIWEDGSACPKFVQDMGDKMDYNVGWSSNQDKMAKTWMAAAGQNGIPTAFVVKNGVVQWIGHPMTLGEPLAKIVDGSYDLGAAMKEFDVRAEKAAAQRALAKKVEDAKRAFTAGDRKGAHATLDAVENASPQGKAQYDLIRLGWMAIEAPEQAKKSIDAYLASGSDVNKQKLCMFVMENASPKSDPRAHSLAGYAIDGATKKWPTDFIAAYYAARYYSESGDAAKTATAVDHALEVIKTSPYKDNKQLAEALQQMKSSKKEG